MHAITLRELQTYFRLTDPSTKYPVGLGLPFIVDNRADELVFRAKLNTTAKEQIDLIDSILGFELVSNTGVRSIVRLDTQYCYLGLDIHSAILPLNIISLTLLKAHSKDTKTIRAKSINRPRGGLAQYYEFNVPSIWWDSLSYKHQHELLAEYFNNSFIGGLEWDLVDSTKYRNKDHSSTTGQEPDINLNDPVNLNTNPLPFTGKVLAGFDQPREADIINPATSTPAITP